MPAESIEKPVEKMAKSLRETRILMGMPVTVELVDQRPGRADALAATFAYFTAIDEQFSTYKDTSEISCFNRGQLAEDALSPAMREVFALAEDTKRATHGYFDIRRPDGSLDPSGIVKGWAILGAAERLAARGFEHFYVEAGGDIQTRGLNAEGAPWAIGIRNPFAMHEIVKVVQPNDAGVATSGTSIRGQHIYNPHAPETPITELVSLSVLGPNILEADRFATAAFAMGFAGLGFVEALEGFEGYGITAEGIAYATSGFARYAAS